MPNTLAHIGIQGLTSRRVIKNADFAWIYIGCIIPDAPWILRRGVTALFGGDPYDLRLYAIVQSSFLFCLILSLALATFSKEYWKTFAILGMNAFLHLFLDALQRKWGNGVHLFAPFDWRLTNFGFFWPESWVTYLLTAFGFVYFWVKWPGRGIGQSNLAFRPVFLIALLTVYLASPLLFLSGPLRADSHFVKTLRVADARQGRAIELDRAQFERGKQGGALRTFAGEKIDAEGIPHRDPAVVSIQGSFISSHRINVSTYHIHSARFRDLASYVGLALVLLYVCRAWGRYRMFNRQ